MKLFDAPATRAALSFDRLVPLLRAAFAGHASVPPRHVHDVQAGGASGTVLIMPAWSDDGYLGIKTINIFPGNGARGLPGLHATYVLYDARTGVPLAQMDGNEITAHRTAAASALGASFLAREDAATLLVLGTGRVARLLPAAHASVRPIREVRVWNHRHDGALALAAEWRAAGWDAHAVGDARDDLADAVQAADIVSCATLATTPPVRGEWLRPGVHLDLIGSFTPAMTEADPACFGPGMRVFVDTDEALLKSGDLLNALAAGTFRAGDLQATLTQLCRGEREGRRSDPERTVLKAVGSALEDLAAATLTWESALDRSGPATPQCGFWLLMLISTQLVDAKNHGQSALPKHTACARCLPVSARTARGAFTRSVLRRRPAARRSHQRTVFAADVAEPAGAGIDRRSRLVDRREPHHADSGSEAT